MKFWFWFCKKLGVLLGLYALVRLCFFAVHFDYLKTMSLGSIMLSMLQGMRFDLSALFLLNGLFFLAWIWGHRLNLAFIIINTLFLELNLIDCVLAKFTGKRIAPDFFLLAQDWIDQTPQISRYYLLPLLLSFVFCGIFVLLNKKMLPPFLVKKKSKTRNALLSSLLMVGLTVLFVRGGWQKKPLSEHHAFLTDSHSLGLFTLNSTYSFLRGIKRRSLPPLTLMPVAEARKLLSEQLAPQKMMPAQLGQNVMIIILESFSLEYMGGLKEAGRSSNKEQKSYTPFLNQLAREGLFFNHHFANGRRSIEALPSILCGMPSLFPEALVTSAYSENKMVGLGNILRPLGYSTFFFHGGRNGTMYFDSFSKRVGMEHYYGRNEYVGPKENDDGAWGIYDEPFFMFAADILNEKKSQPFTAAFFTLSSHHPYHIPPKLKGKFLKGELDIHESIGYTDYALAEFFKYIKDMPFYKNTLFIFTADHTQELKDPAGQNLLGLFRVPLLFYHPQKEKLPEVDQQRIVQHIDILPSVLHWLGVKRENTIHLLGRSIFEPEQEGLAFNFTEGKFWYVDAQVFLELSPEGVAHEFKHQYTYDLTPAVSTLPQKEKLFKAFLQYYYDGVIYNRLYNTGHETQVSKSFR